MSRPSIDERFAQFEEDAVPTFKPEVDRVYAGVQRMRRKRRKKMAIAAAVVLIAVPLVWFGIGQLGKSGKPNPEPVAVAPERKIAIPGVSLPGKPTVEFTDANSAVAVLNSCVTANTPICEYAAGFTTDGGRTWQRINLPKIPDNHEAQMVFRDPAAYLVIARPRSSREPDAGVAWVTRDGGATFTDQPKNKVPDGFPDHDEYEIKCPGYSEQMYGPEETLIPTPGCGPTKLVVRATGQSVATQPAGIDHTARITIGVDGRLWVMTGTGADARRLQMSADKGKTWQAMPGLPAQSFLYLSWDGKEVYYQARPRINTDGSIAGPGEVAQLLDGKWVRQLEIPTVVSFFMAVPLGDGALLVSTMQNDGSYSNVYRKDGVESAVPPDLQTATVTQQPIKDGTIVLTAKKGVYLGVGYGLSREWTFISF